MTEQLDMLQLEDLSPTFKPSTKATKTTEPKPEEEAEEESEPEPQPEAEEEEEVTRSKASSWSSGYVNIYTWGVKDVNGNWVTIPADPDVAPMDYRSVPQVAEYLTHKKALEVFETHPYAAQLIEGCDWWACLDDTPEVLVVRKEKKGVPAPEAVPGAGTVGDGPESTEAACEAPERSIERVA